MAEALELRRKRLLFRCWHRGTREMGLLLGGFAARHLAGLSEEELARFEALLQHSDPDLYDWISGRRPVPPEHDHGLMELLKNFKLSAVSD